MSSKERVRKVTLPVMPASIPPEPHLAEWTSGSNCSYLNFYSCFAVSAQPLHWAVGLCTVNKGLCGALWAGIWSSAPCGASFPWGKGGRHEGCNTTASSKGLEANVREEDQAARQEVRGSPLNLGNDHEDVTESGTEAQEKRSENCRGY
jgi:hypothetical protein